MYPYKYRRLKGVEITLLMCSIVILLCYFPDQDQSSRPVNEYYKGLDERIYSFSYLRI